MSSVLVSPLAAFAQNVGEDRRRAGAAFAEGDTLYEQGNWADALTKFDESYRIVPHIATKFNIAKCLEKLNRFTEADRAYAEVEAGEDPDLAAGAREARARIARQMGTIRVNVPPDVEVTIDGNPCPAPCEQRVPVGAHDVVIGTGVDATHQTVNIAAGDTKTVDRATGQRMQFEDEEHARGGGGPTEDEEAGISASTEDVRLDQVLLWGGVGLTAVGVGMTVIFGLRANSLEEEVSADRLSGPNPDDVESGESAATLANVGVVVLSVGVGLAATGFVLGLNKGGGGDESEGGGDSGLDAELRIAPGALFLAGSF
ncbi:MAG: CDC27 family protein [Actinobacteria bacterium]|nr:CDC27 family protein [Actinomycetota bacterium]